MIAAAYIRVSTEDQTEYSPDSQLKRIYEYAQRHDMQIPEDYIFIDEGISGRTASKRPAFQQMIALARREHPFQKILVWKFSRFARNRQDSIFYKSMLRKDCGIEVISVSEPLAQDATSILMEALLEAMDEYYSINLAQEVKRGMQERFSRGKAISIPPFGYQMGNNSFEIQSQQAQWVKIIFQDFAEGKSLKEIADRLNNAGITTSRGNPFQSRNIAYILHNPVYIGKLRKRASPPVATAYDRNYIYSDMEVTDGIHPPIISQALWQAVQSRSMLSQYEAPDLSPLPKEYYLKHLVYCSACRHPLIHIQSHHAFQCSRYNHGKCRVSHYIKAERLEALVTECLASWLSPAELLVLRHPGIPAQEKNAVIRHLNLQIIYEKPSDQIRIVPVKPDS